jgi:hypothetical protein
MNKCGWCGDESQYDARLKHHKRRNVENSSYTRIIVRWFHKYRFCHLTSRVKSIHSSGKIMFNGSLWPRAIISIDFRMQPILSLTQAENRPADDSTKNDTQQHAIH